MANDFIEFKKIPRFNTVHMSITQKLHGTNAQVYIKDGIIKAGCRSRYLSPPSNDNMGFGAFVHANADAFIELLGEGRHFGEWVGKGINSGEGLKEKYFVLFDYWKYKDRPNLPPQTLIVPVLYSGKLDIAEVWDALELLRQNGSQLRDAAGELLAPDFKRCEGIVISLDDKRYKIVFEPEETAWTKGDKVKITKDRSAWMHLLQPIRMEKLLSRDESYIRNYPANLPDIMRAYMKDLEDENQLPEDEDQKAAARKSIGSLVFALAKECIERNNNG